MVKTLAWQVRDPGLCTGVAPIVLFTIKNLPIKVITLVLMSNDLSCGIRKRGSKILSDHSTLLGMIKLIFILTF